MLPLPSPERRRERRLVAAFIATSVAALVGAELLALDFTLTWSISGLLGFGQAVFWSGFAILLLPCLAVTGWIFARVYWIERTGAEIGATPTA